MLMVPAVPRRGQFSFFSTEINVFVLVTLASADVVPLHVVSPECSGVLVILCKELVKCSSIESTT